MYVESLNKQRKCIQLLEGSSTVLDASCTCFPSTYPRQILLPQYFMFRWSLFAACTGYFFVVHFKTLSVSKITQCRITGRCINSNCKEFVRKLLWPNRCMISKNLFGNTENNKKTSVSRCSGRDLNRSHLKYKSRV